MKRAVTVGILAIVGAFAWDPPLPADPTCNALNEFTLRDPVRPDRPEPLVSVATADAGPLMAELKATLSRSGFAVSKFNSQTGEVLGNRALRKGRDRVFLWLERSYTSPSTHLYVHAVFEHVEPVLGTDSGLAVIPLSEPNFDRHFGPLQKRLVSLALEARR